MQRAGELRLDEQITLNDGKALVERTGGQRQRVCSHGNTGRAHPGAKRRAMRGGLVMAMLTLVEDRLSRREAADPHNAENQDEGDGKVKTS